MANRALHVLRTAAIVLLLGIFISHGPKWYASSKADERPHQQVHVLADIPSNSIFSGLIFPPRVEEDNHTFENHGFAHLFRHQRSPHVRHADLLRFYSAEEVASMELAHQSYERALDDPLVPLSSTTHIANKAATLVRFTSRYVLSVDASNTNTDTITTPTTPITDASRMWPYFFHYANYVKDLQKDHMRREVVEGVVSIDHHLWSAIMEGQADEVLMLIYNDWNAGTVAALTAMRDFVRRYPWLKPMNMSGTAMVGSQVLIAAPAAFSSVWQARHPRTFGNAPAQPAETILRPDADVWLARRVASPSEDRRIPLVHLVGAMHLPSMTFMASNSSAPCFTHPLSESAPYAVFVDRLRGSGQHPITTRALDVKGLANFVVRHSATTVMLESLDQIRSLVCAYGRIAILVANRMQSRADWLRLWISQRDSVLHIIRRQHMPIFVYTPTTGVDEAAFFSFLSSMTYRGKRAVTSRWRVLIMLMESIHRDELACADPREWVRTDITAEPPEMGEIAALRWDRWAAHELIDLIEDEEQRRPIVDVSGRTFHEVLDATFGYTLRRPRPRCLDGEPSAACLSHPALNRPVRRWHPRDWRPWKRSLLLVMDEAHKGSSCGAHVRRMVLLTNTTYDAAEQRVGVISPDDAPELVEELQHAAVMAASVPKAARELCYTTVAQRLIRHGCRLWCQVLDGTLMYMEDLPEEATTAAVEEEEGKHADEEVAAMMDAHPRPLAAPSHRVMMNALMELDALLEVSAQEHQEQDSGEATMKSSLHCNDGSQPSACWSLVFPPTLAAPVVMYAPYDLPFGAARRGSLHHTGDDEHVPRTQLSMLLLHDNSCGLSANYVKAFRLIRSCSTALSMMELDLSRAASGQRETTHHHEETHQLCQHIVRHPPSPTSTHEAALPSTTTATLAHWSKLLCPVWLSLHHGMELRPPQLLVANSTHVLATLSTSVYAEPGDWVAALIAMLRTMDEQMEANHDHLRQCTRQRIQDEVHRRARMRR